MDVVYGSDVAPMLTVYLVIIVVVCYFRPLKGTPEPGEIHLIYFTHNFISTFPIQVFAYTCAQNVSILSVLCVSYAHFWLQLFPIYNELASNTQERMNIVIGSSIGGAAVTYEIIAVFGYLTFGTKVRVEH